MKTTNRPKCSLYADKRNKDSLWTQTFNICKLLKLANNPLPYLSRDIFSKKGFHHRIILLMEEELPHCWFPGPRPDWLVVCCCCIWRRRLAANCRVDWYRWFLSTSTSGVPWPAPKSADWSCCIWLGISELGGWERREPWAWLDEVKGLLAGWKACELYNPEASIPLTIP